MSPEQYYIEKVSRLLRVKTITCDILTKRKVHVVVDTDYSDGQYYADLGPQEIYRFATSLDADNIEVREEIYQVELDMYEQYKNVKLQFSVILY